jgi:hypothetical protein
MALKLSKFSLSLFSLLLAFTAFSSAQTLAAPHVEASHKASVDKPYGKAPLQFEENQGQADPAAKLLARGPGYSILLQPTAATFVLHKGVKNSAKSIAAATAPVQSETVRMSLSGASKTATIAAQQRTKSYVNYMTGSDRSKWQIGVPTFAQARVSAAYPGIDLVYYGNQRQMEYDFIVAPKADASAIQLSIAGAKPVLAADGALILQASAQKHADDLQFQKPVLYQEVNGKRLPVDGSFTIAANGTVGFKVGDYDHTRELIIDPIISYASYFGGAGEDEINGSALNAANQLYAVGQSFSTTLPATAGEFQAVPATNNNGHDAFVTKFSADGSTILWTTYLSGITEDLATGVAVNSSDQAYIVGYTNSCGSGGTGYGTSGEFPFTSDAIQPLCNPQVIGFNNYETNGGNFDAFLVKLSSDGKTELYGTPLGGSNNDFASGVLLDASGKVYIVGETSSTEYYAPNPTSRSAPIPNYPMGPASYYLPANVGTANYPTTTTAFYTNTTESQLNATTASNGDVQGPTDEQAFVTVLSADLHSFVYSSLLGGPVLGSAGNGTSSTNGIAIAVNAKGIIFIGGNTSSAHWPVTPNAFAPTCANAGAANSTCNLNGWLAAFDPTKTGAASLLFNTYMTGQTAGKNGSGGNIDPSSDVFGLTTDSTGNVIATGDVNATDFPTTAGVIEPSCPRVGDGTNACQFGGFLTKLSSTGTTVWSTYFDSPVEDGGFVNGRGLAVDASNNVYLLALASTSGLPLKNPIASSANGADAYLAELSPTASTLLMGTYLGATSGIALDNNSLHLDSNLNAYFSGSQGYNPYGGTSFPVTKNAPGPTLLGNADGFVVKIITQQQPSATALVVSPSGSAAPSQTITLTATVTTTSTLVGTILPTGTVTFLNGSATIGTTAGSVTLGTANVNAQGVASTTVKPVVGMYSVVATYAGTYNQTTDPTGYGASTSAGAALTVTKAATSITVTSSTASAGIGSSFTLTGTVPAGATGTVSFYNGTTLLGTGTVGSAGTATLSLSIATAGTYNISAIYTGDTNYSGSTSASMVQVVIMTPSFTLTASPASLTIARGAVGTTTLTITPKGGYTGTLTFACGTLPSKATCTFNPATVVVGAAAVSTTLSIGTGGASTSAALPKAFDMHGAIYAGVFLGLLGFARRKRLIKSAGLLVALVCLAGLGAITGCGGNNAPSTANDTPAGSYTISVTGTATSGTPQAISIVVVVQ